jgi:hypothetical protein
MEADRIVAILEEFLADRNAGLVAVYLFGSLGRGTAGPSSDVDLGLLYAEPPDPGLSGPRSRLEEELERVLGRPVQAVVLNSASPDLVHRVLRDGKLVYEGDRSKRVRFEVAARRDYLDLLPVLLRYRRLEERRV